MPGTQGFQRVTDFHDGLWMPVCGRSSGPIPHCQRKAPTRGYRQRPALQFARSRDDTMQRSTTRFLTTHPGSLPRPDDLIRLMYAKQEGVLVAPTALAARVTA